MQWNTFAGTTGKILRLCAQSFTNPRQRQMLKAEMLWQLSLFRKERAEWNRPETFTVLLSSYKRPWNMQKIVDTLLRCGFVGKIILTNNNPDLRMENYVRSHERLTLLNQPQRQWSAFRMLLAAKEDAQYFCAIDDDIFLRPSQLTMLAEGLLENPAVVHGMYGTRIERSETGERRVNRGVWGADEQLDVIQRVYFFTKDHLKKFVPLYERIQKEKRVPQEILDVSDDILLSLSGAGKPQCHTIPAFAECYTSTAENIALYKTVPGFVDGRTNLLLELVQ